MDLFQEAPSQSSVQPPTSAQTLPRELERLIFEICALSRPTLIPKLMRVAWRVKEWVEPLLYRTIILSYAPPLDGYPEFTDKILSFAMRSKPSTFFRDSVRNLLLYCVPNSKEILTICTSVENLWIVGTSAGQFDFPATLKHLYTDVLELLCGPPATRPLFSQLTHLELMGPTQADEDIDVLFSSISQLPQLTHLAFYEEGFTSIFLPLLQTCGSLEVLVFFSGKRLKEFEYEDSLANDLRFVVLPMSSKWFEDWQRGLHTGVDYWSRARWFIAKRRSGEIDRLIYVIPADQEEDEIPIDEDE
ncbi:hypothetical protein B0H11DRAFT_1247761 [Mycena galericulata]|nr:hypothetical protein B0H11DRAFT_2115965 [Mycena galericulata]KAJ7480375.1 hypothetical protein B0H11DRAFT_1247761 [Mycena galericulata]